MVSVKTDGQQRDFFYYDKRNPKIAMERPVVVFFCCCGQRTTIKGENHAGYVEIN